MGNETTEFPAIFSDDEFEALHFQRAQIDRRNRDAADITDAQQANAPGDGRPESTIEQRFTHVAKMLVAMWPSEAFALYVKRLVVADRETRAGFPRDVIEDLLMLDAVNDMLIRKIASRQAGPVNTATDRNVRSPDS